MRDIHPRPGVLLISWTQMKWWKLGRWCTAILLRPNVRSHPRWIVGFSRSLIWEFLKPFATFEGVNIIDILVLNILYLRLFNDGFSHPRLKNKVRVGFRTVRPRKNPCRCPNTCWIIQFRNWFVHRFMYCVVYFKLTCTVYVSWYIYRYCNCIHTQMLHVWNIYQHVP